MKKYSSKTLSSREIIHCMYQLTIKRGYTIYWTLSGTTTLIDKRHKISKVLLAFMKVTKSYNSSGDFIGKRPTLRILD